MKRSTFSSHSMAALDPACGAGTRRRIPSLMALLGSLMPVIGLSAIPSVAAYDDPAPVYDLQELQATASLNDGETVREFARVRYAEETVRVTRSDGYAEDVAFNEPIYEGDTIETDARQRAEIQLPDGSLVRVDRLTNVEVFSLAGATPGFGESILGVSFGRIQVDVPDPSVGDGFRVDTPAASVYPLEPSAFRVDVLDGDEVTVLVQSGRVEVSGARGSEVLDVGEVTRVRPGDAPRRPYRVNLLARDGFGRWVADRDDVYRLRARPGEEYRSIPAEVRPYYGELARYGSWSYADDYGWVWVPVVDDEWYPYTRGYWESGPYGPVWVATEPWGWPVYRYGRWEHSVRLGWLWIPGRVFRPAHVVWYYGPSYVGWCPLGYYDSPVHVSLTFGWGHSYFHSSPWLFVGYDHFYHRGGPYIGHHGGSRLHASAVRRELGEARGVISRRAIVPRSSDAGPGPDRRPRASAKGSFEAAQERLAARRAVVRRSGSSAPDAGTAEPTRVVRRPFRDEERGLAPERSERTRVKREAATQRERPTEHGSAGAASRSSGSRPAVPRRGKVEAGQDTPGSGGTSRPAPRRSERPDPIIRVEPGGRDAEAVQARPGRRTTAGPPPSKRPAERVKVGEPVSPRRSAPSATTGTKRESSAAKPAGRTAEDSVRRFIGRLSERPKAADAPGADRRRAVRGETPSSAQAGREARRSPPSTPSTARRPASAPQRPVPPKATPRAPSPQRPDTTSPRSSRSGGERAAPRGARSGGEKPQARPRDGGSSSKGSSSGKSSSSGKPASERSKSSSSRRR